VTRRKPAEEVSEQTLGEWWADFRRRPWREKLMTIAAFALLVPILVVVFLVGFFLFGGWAVFADHLPAWAERLFTFLLIVLLAWAFLKPTFDRWERGAK
jgi:hypothetical protein